MPDVLVLIANTPIRPRQPRISAIVSSCLRAIILGSFGFQGRFPARAVELHDDGPFWPKAYMLSRVTFWSKGYLITKGILFEVASCTERKAEKVDDGYSSDRKNGANKVVWSKLIRPLAPTETTCTRV